MKTIKSRQSYSRFIIIILLLIAVSACQKSEKFHEGLAGIYFSEPNLTSIKAYSVLTSLEQVWGQDYEYGTESSGRWNGYLSAPTGGKVRLHLSTNRKVRLNIQGKGEIETEAPSAATLDVPMIQGERVPVELIFWNDNKEGVFIPSADMPQNLADSDAFFSVKWEWEGLELSEIPSAFLSHSSTQSAPLAHISEPDPSSIDMSQFIRVPGKHVVVYHEEGRFGGWPANNGIWSWGNEILVGFTRGYFRFKKHHHSYDKTKPGFLNFARSIDGGETWSIEDPGKILGKGGKPGRLTHQIDYSHPDFALRNDREQLHYSYDRGRTWKGPYAYPDLKKGPLTSRTDYMPENRDDCLLFLSSKTESVKATLQDRAFCARAGKGGKKVTFLGWMTETDTIRSVMPATVRISETHLISAMRRRYDPPITEEPVLTRNWIDVYESKDNGVTWSFLNKIANTDTGLRNGNPPSMARLDNGRICVMYGYRGVPYSIRARVSDDNGKTWSREIILRDKARNWDIGYTRSVVRPDQKVVTLYYFTSDDPFENHIVATIWDPMDVEI
jgi:hypothetical protein